MSRPHLLLLDPDASHRESLAAELRQAGLTLTDIGTADDLSAVAEAGALLVVDGEHLTADLVPPLQAPGRMLLAGLRSPDATREQELLTAGVARVLPLGSGLAAELTTILDQLPVAEPSEMEGAFTPEALAAAIDHVGPRSAVITSTAPSGEVGTIWLRDGRIVDVQLGALAPGRALARLFTWKDGRCHILMGSHDHDETIALDAHLGGEEALRRAEVWQRLVAALGGTEAVFKVDYVALARLLADVPDDANVILRLVDGTRDLATIIDQVPFDELHTLAVALRLRVDGVLVAVHRAELVPAQLAEPPSTGSEPEAGPPLITVQAIDEALAWVAAPSMVPWTPTKGHIPVVQYMSRRGARRDRLVHEAMERREQAAQRDERPMLLTDEVLAPGALPILTSSTDRTEILVSAARSPVSERTNSSRGLMMALTIAAIALSLVIVVQSLRREEAPLPEAPLVEAPTPPQAMAPPPVPPPEPAHVDVPLPPPVAPPEKAEKKAVAPAPPVTPATFEALLKAGTQANTQGNTAKAIPLLEQAVAKKPAPSALLELGKAYYASDKLDLAIKSLDRATKLDGKLTTGFMYLGMALQDAHRPADAKTAYKRFLELEPPASPRHAEISSVLSHL